VRLNQRVTDIKYDLINSGGVGRRAKVRAQSGGSASFRSQQCTEYTAKRVIASVSAGVLNHDLIRFDPPLKYPAATSNPMQMQQYIKIFYQFPTIFWDDTEFIVTLKVRITRTGAAKLMPGLLLTFPIFSRTQRFLKLHNLESAIIGKIWMPEQSFSMAAVRSFVL
jgi:hypothetical protein